MKPSRWLIVFAVLSVAPVSAFAKEKLPLPAQVLAARAVYIDNQSGSTAIGDTVLEEVEKWGRFKIVENWKDADLVLLLTPKKYYRGYITTVGGKPGGVDDRGNFHTTTGTANTTASTVRYTYLTVIDTKSGDNLWGESRKWSHHFTGPRSVAHGLVLELRMSIEEQTNQESKTRKN